MATDIFYLIDGNRRVRSLTDDGEPDAIELFRSDESKWRLHPLKKNPAQTPGKPFIYASARPATLKFSAGVIDAIPEGGTFTLTGAAGGTTAALAYDASGATIQAAIRAALTGFSAAIVTLHSTGVFTVDRGATGAVGDITGASDALVPSGSTVNIVNSQQGTASVNEKWQVRLRKASPFLCTSWSAFDSLTFAATLVTAGSATQKETHLVSWNADTYEGNCYLQVSTTGSDIRTIGPIPYNATADEFLALLEKHENLAAGDLVSVAQNGPGSYTITFDESFTSAPTVVVGSNTFKVPIGDQADIGVATAESDAILGTLDEADVTLEIEVREDSGKPRTIQETAKLKKDLITSTPGQTTGVDNFLTESDIQGSLSVGTLKFGDGTIGAPSITFDDRPQIGWYHSDTSQISTVIDGVVMQRWDTDGTTFTQGVRYPIATKTNNYTATTGDYTLLFNIATAKSLTLPAAADNTGRMYAVKNLTTSADDLTLDPNASENIEGGASYILSIGEGALIACDGAAWHVIAKI